MTLPGAWDTELAIPNDMVLAGPALDAHVSELVFGLGWQRFSAVTINGALHEITTWLPAGSNPADPPKGCHAGQNPPPHSREIQPAMRIVAHLEGRGWGHKHIVHSPDAENPGVFWWFMKPGEGAQSMVAVKASTIPLAICGAAILALTP